MNHKPLLFLSVSLVAGCGITVDGNLAETSRNVVIVCKDSRDGEIFSFNTNTVTNVRIGFGAPSTFDVITSDGKKRMLSSTLDTVIKCE